jgi:DDE superfamily endonuclease
MDNSKLARFRVAVVACFRKARGALSDLCDALATDVDAPSRPELSESPFFRRKWPSLYKAVSRGRIDRSGLQQAFAAAVPPPRAGARLVVAVDVRPMVRRQARTSADRTFVHVPNVPEGAAPVLPGYQFSELVVVPYPVSSAVHVRDNQRIPSTETAASVGAAQLRAVLPLLQPVRPILLGDGGYGNVPWLAATADVPVDQLRRIARNSVF